MAIKTHPKIIPRNTLVHDFPMGFEMKHQKNQASRDLGRLGSSILPSQEKSNFPELDGENPRCQGENHENYPLVN